MSEHNQVSSRVTMQTPFATIRSTYSAKERGRRSTTSRNFNWIGKITHCHREADRAGRMAFLYDVEPVIGAPAAPDAPRISNSKGAKNSVFSRVRLLQPLCGSLFKKDSPATGVIIVPEVGSLVLVGEDPFGWIILGFLSGPSTPFGAVAAIAEVTENPGFEEVANSLYDNAPIPKLFELSEGDIILGRQNQRVRLAAEGLFIGASVHSCELFRTDGYQRMSRFVNLEERGPGFLGYKRTFYGTSLIPAYSGDSSTVHSQIIDTNYNLANLRPYVVRQVGHVTADHLRAGHYAGEIIPAPNTTTTEQTSKQHTIIRETVVQPVTPIVGSSADANELVTQSGVVYDFQVRADGSFHIRSGKAAPVPTPGASEYGKPTDHTMDLQFDALTKTLKLRLGVSGAPLINIVANGAAGTLTVLAATSIALQAPVLTLPIATTINAQAPLILNAPSIVMNAQEMLTINTKVLAINGGTSGSWVAGVIKVPGDVQAGVVSLLLHKHNYVLPLAPSPTQPGISTPSIP